MTQAQPETAAGPGETRTRTYSWSDRPRPLAALAGRPGLDLLTAMQRGELPLPPVMSTLVTTKYLRPVTSGTREVTVTGNVLSRGSRTALAQATLTGASGRMLAHATSTCMIFGPRG